MFSKGSQPKWTPLELGLDPVLHVAQTWNMCWGLVLSWSGWEAAKVLSHCSATVLYFCTNLFLLIWLVYLLASPQAGVAFSQQDFWFSFNRLLCGGNVKCLVSLWRQGEKYCEEAYGFVFIFPKAIRVKFMNRSVQLCRVICLPGLLSLQPHWRTRFWDLCVWVCSRVNFDVNYTL